MVINQILQNIFKMYPNQAKHDLLKSALSVLTLIPKDEKKIVKKIIVGSKQDGPYIHNNYYVYYTGGTEANNQQHPLWQWMGDRLLRTTRGKLTPGLWMTADENITHGYGVFTLVQHIKGCTDFEAFMYVAEYVGTKFSAENVPQQERNDGYVFIRDSHTYPETSATYLLDNASSLGVDVLGFSSRKYIFRNDHGQLSFYLIEWNNNEHGQVRLFQTLQHNKETGQREWRFISPPKEFLIYNRHLIDRAKNKEILIYDQIERVESRDINHKLAVATWSGDLSIYSQLDWSFLKNRRVTYIFNKKDQDSIKIGLKLIEDFKQMGTELKLRCIPPP